MSRNRFVRPLLSAFVLVAGMVAAHSVTPRLNNLTPISAQRGSEVEVKFNGARLDDTMEILFYGPGLSVAKMEPAKSNSVSATLRIAPDCRLGEHPIRLRTATGVSEVRTLWVGPFPSVAEKEPNNEAAQAGRLTGNTTVSGTIPAEDVDCFVVTAKQGQRLCAEVQAMRLGRAAFDASLAILDGAGEIVALSEDSSLALQDPMLSIVVPKDGDYVIQVRETTYGGTGDAQYLLHVGDFPRPTAVYPAGGLAGGTLAVKFLGDAKGEFSQQIKLASVPQDKLGAEAVQNGVAAPTPNWLRVSPFPNVLEAGPNQDRERATATDKALPLALNGIVSKPGEADWFRFKAKKGQALDVNLFARRLRSPLDSVVEVFDDKGASVASNDDSTGPDSAVKFTPDGDRDYFVRVKDHLNLGGADFVYRIEITPQQPSLALTIPQVARNESQSRQYIAVPRGNRFATLVSARRGNFSGDLAFRVEGLPAGVTLRADTMSSKVDAMPLVFEAAPDAPVAGKLLDLVAAWQNPDNKGAPVEGRYRNDIELVQGPNNTVYYGTRVDQIVVAVTEEAPFKIRFIEPKAPLVQGGSMDLKVVAERAAGFDEPITLKMVWNPPGVSSASDVTLAKGESNALYRLNASRDAQVRAWQIAVNGSATVQGGSLHVSSQLGPLEVGEPFLTAKIETAAVEPGRSTNVVCKLDQRLPFEGKATIKLVGLPEKVAVPEKEITKDDKEVIFKVTVDSTCPTGSHKNLFCNVSLQKNGEPVMHNIGQGGIVRIVPPKKAPSTNAPVAKVAARGEASSRK